MRYLLFLLLPLWIASGCRPEGVTFSENADDLFWLRSDGADMPITVRGNTLSKTILLVVHGGPGLDALSYDSQSALLKKEFAMAYWDQRSSGSSQGTLNQGKLTVEQFALDLRQVILLLKAKYGQDIGVFLYSHSWGGMVAPAFLTSGDNQTLVKGWINADGWHNAPLSDSLSKAMQIEWATKMIAANSPDKAAWQKILDFANANDPQENWIREYQFTSNAHECESLLGDSIADFSFGGIAGNPYQQGVSLWQRLGNAVHVAVLSPEFAESTIRKNYSQALEAVSVPVLCIFGKYDFVCPPGLADDVIAHMPLSQHKFKVILDKSGHPSMYAEPEKFQQEVAAFVRQFR